MVVVAIIGVLALLGLRLYTGQQDKAKNAIVIANASTIHTLLQGAMLDKDYTSVPTGATLFGDIGGTVNGNDCTALANMRNPFGGDNIAIMGTIGTNGSEGEVVVQYVSPNEFDIQGVGAGGTVTGDTMTAQK